jgi:hypothetical protein
MTRPAAGHGEAVSAVGVVEALFLASRLQASHGAAHPLAQQAVESLASAVGAAHPPFSMQFIRHAVFRDKVLVPFDLPGFEKSQVLAQAMAQLGVHEIILENPVRVTSMLGLASLLGHPAAAAQETQGEISFPGVLVREIPGANLAQSAEAVDPEVFVAGQLALAIADGEELVALRGKPWPWFLGLSCARRVERCLGVGAAALLRALEIAPGPWSEGRRTVAAAINTAVCLELVGVGPQLRKVAVHIALALGAYGLEPRAGRPLGEAAVAALAAMLPLKGARPMEPHKTKVCAQLHRLAGDPARNSRPGVGPLLGLTYALEVARLPLGLDFALTLADLVAQAHAGALAAPGHWLLVLVKASGAIPPGARVRLPDGRVGLVLGQGEQGDPLRPKVLVGGNVVMPSGAVTVLGPLEFRGAADGA